MSASPVIQEQSLPTFGKQVVTELLEKINSQQPKIPGYYQVAKDVILRLNAGEHKYGSVLMTHNGRSADLDTYQELCDGIAYMTQKIFETSDAEVVLSLIDDIDMIYFVAINVRQRLVQEGIL